VVYKILKNGRVKISLQNAIGAIHIAKGTDVQNLIIATGIVTCARALFYESPLVSGQV
jgi:hypothetical protein